MPVHPNRNVRNLAAFLLTLSGISHVAQLWFRDTDAETLLTALLGMVYLVLALGLSGQSRFALWAAAVTLLTDAANSVLSSRAAADPLLLWHFAVDGIVAILCVYILYRTRFADMD